MRDNNVFTWCVKWVVIWAKRFGDNDWYLSPSLGMILTTDCPISRKKKSKSCKASVRTRVQVLIKLIDYDWHRFILNLSEYLSKQIFSSNQMFFFLLLMKNLHLIRFTHKTYYTKRKIYYWIFYDDACFFCLCILKNYTNLGDVN